MTTRPSFHPTGICQCAPETLKPRVYFVWSDNDDKERVEGVCDVYVTHEDVVLDRVGQKPAVFPLRKVFMVTCEICSPPPCN